MLGSGPSCVGGLDLVRSRHVVENGWVVTRSSPSVVGECGENGKPRLGVKSKHKNRGPNGKAGSGLC